METTTASDPIPSIHKARELFVRWGKEDVWDVWAQEGKIDNGLLLSLQLPPSLLRNYQTWRESLDIHCDVRVAVEEVDVWLKSLGFTGVGTIVET
jgi:hypothetical protein